MILGHASLAACLWLVIANVVAMFPSRDNHWKVAYLLILVGVPLLGWLTMQSGPWVALIFLAAGASVLRWPLIHLTRWIRSRIGD